MKKSSFQSLTIYDSKREEILGKFISTNDFGKFPVGKDLSQADARSSKSFSDMKMGRIELQFQKATTYVLVRIYIPSKILSASSERKRNICL